MNKITKISTKQLNEIFREILVYNIGIKEAAVFTQKRLSAIIKLIKEEKELILHNPSRIHKMIKKTEQYDHTIN